MPDPVPGFRLAVRDLTEAGAQPYPSDRWTISTATEMPGFEATKLKTDLLSDYWSAINHRGSGSWIEAVSDAATSSSRVLKLLGLLGLNRRSPSALIAGTTYTSNTARIRVDSYPLSTRIRPTFTLSSKVNLTGADSALTGHPIDPPDDPAPTGYSETKLTPTNPALPTSLIATFNNPYSTERTLTGTVTLRTHLRDVNDPTEIPVVTLVVDQASGGEGPSVFSVYYERVTALSSSGGFIATYTFPVTDLNNLTEPILAHISCATACELIGLEMVIEHTGYLYDSGTIDLSAQEPALILAARPDLTLPSGVVYVHVEMSDFYAYATASYTLGGSTASARTATPIIFPGDADGRCHVGRLVAADALIFPIAIPGGYELQTLSSSEPARTRAGSLRGNRVAVEWTEVDLSIIGISRVLMQKILRQTRALGIMRVPTLLVPDPGFTEGLVDEETAPRWVVVGSKSQAHIGRLRGRDEDVDADGVDHTRDRWDLSLHLMDHNAVRSGGR